MTTQKNSSVTPSDPSSPLPAQWGHTHIRSVEAGVCRVERDVQVGRRGRGGGGGGLAGKGRRGTIAEGPGGGGDRVATGGVDGVGAGLALGSSQERQQEERTKGRHAAWEEDKEVRKLEGDEWAT